MIQTITEKVIARVNIIVDVACFLRLPSFIKNQALIMKSALRKKQDDRSDGHQQRERILHASLPFGNTGKGPQKNFTKTGSGAIDSIHL